MTEKEMEKRKEMMLAPSGVEIRYEVVNGEPVFVAKDVCESLGINQYHQVFARLGSEYKGGTVTLHTLGGKQRFSTLNEAGLYALIFQSSKPKAKRFTRWVTTDVLPSIRKTGGYGRNVIDMPKSIYLCGMEAMPYVEWLLQNGYSVMSGAVRERIRKHPEHFYKDARGKWYINVLFAQWLLSYRESAKRIGSVKGLPVGKQMSIEILS